MKGQFVVAIEHLECLGRLGNGFEIVPGLRVVDDGKRVECLSSVQFKELAGSLETNHLKESKFLVCTDIQDFVIPSGQMQILKILDIVNNFLNELWLLIEHTAFYDRGYLLEGNLRLHSNTQLTATYDWKGERRLVRVARGDLEIAKLRFRQLYSESVSEDYSIAEDRSALGGLRTAAHRDVDLYARFSTFVHYVRQAHDPALRIAFTCSALEVIFSTGTSELTHRVSERVSFLLGSDGPQRQEFYLAVKRLYGIRSAFLHGDSVKKADEANLEKHVREADRILRGVSIKVHTDEAFQKAVIGGKETLDAFHTRLLFK